jgi:hypothetical protein
MRRPFLIAFAVILTASALILTSCAGADQQGDAAQRMSAWARGTSLGGDIGTLIADNARVSKIAPNGAGALHAACSTLLNDAQMAYAELPSPDPDVTQLLNDAYDLEQTAANDCYDAGTTDEKLLTTSERDGIKADALYQEVIDRVRQIDGRAPVTTTTSGNSGNTGIGGILG